jgi:GNAT superfamily N-acetyltransferase
MLRTWTAGEVGERARSGTARLREVMVEDAEVLGSLFWRGFGRGGADGFDSEADARAEARGTLAGSWGPMVWKASLLGLVDGVAVAASVVVRDDAHELLPLLAFLVTDPGHQRRGLGEQLLHETIVRLDGVGVRELHLAVDPGNDARRLYERLGFHEP